MAKARSKQEEKNKGGRPSKLTPDVVDIFEEVVNANILCCTDEELFLLLNDELEEADRVSYRTFQRWKAGEDKENDELFNRFCRLIKKALIKEKRNLLDHLKTEEKQWQKWAWIIERKFDEWNIKQKIEGKQELTGKDGGPIQQENVHKVVFEDYGDNE